MMRPHSPRAGFTLIEMLVVVVVVGILAGLALPNLRQAIFQADAAKIASDVHTVELGVRTYMEDQGAVPPGGKWGVIPPKLAEYLPEKMPFVYKSVEYRIVVQKKKGTVRLEARYANKDPIGLALQRLSGKDVTWTRKKTTFWFER